MEREIYNLIQKHDSIIVARHKNPDLDAYGSQFGLYHALKLRYPEKKIYVVGDSNNQNYFGDFDELDIETRQKSLVFILDTVSKQMLREIDYLYHDELVLIDHHLNIPDIEYDYYIRDTESSSTAEMVTGFLVALGFELNHDAARALYMGIIGDTGRFMYNSTSSRTLYTAAKLLEKGIDLQKIHDQMYLESFESKKIKSDFFSSIKLTRKKVAYRKNDQDFLDKYDLDPNYVSRGLISQMAGIKEVPIWANFTFDKKNNQILCELRSREYPIVDVALKYGGGGHLTACGCSVSSWEEVDNIINDLNKLVKGGKKNGTKANT